MEDKKKKTRKRILLILFILFNAGVILWTALKEFSGMDSAAKLSDVKLHWWMLIPATGCWVVAIVAEVCKYAVMMKELCGFVKWKLCWDTVLLGRYYDNITPSGVGGQPFQIYYMKKAGLKNSESATIPLVGFVSMQFSFIVIGLVLFIVFSQFIEVGFVKVTSYVGLAFYAFFPLLILLSALFEKQMIRVMHWFVYLLAKIRIIKDPYKTYTSWSANVLEYSVATKHVISKAGLSTKVMLLGMVYQMGVCSIPYFVVLAFGGEVSYLMSLVNIVSIYATITFIPTPGNAGVAEGAFYAIFSMLTSGYIFWAMLTWRFYVFYLFIIIGLLIILRNSLNQRRARIAAQEEADEHSTVC